MLPDAHARLAATSITDKENPGHVHEQNQGSPSLVVGRVLSSYWERRKMKTIYAVACPFYGDGDAGSNATEAWNLVFQWANRGGSQIAEAESPDGACEMENGSTIRWSSVESEERSVRRLVHRIPPGEDTPTGWQTYLWVCRDGDQAWAQVRSGPENRAWVVSAVPYEAGRPGNVITNWLKQQVVVRDRLRLSESALNYGQNDADKLIELLLSPRRELPVVAIAKTLIGGVQRSLIESDKLAYQLAGNAHVVVLDNLCCWKVTEALGQQLSVFHGGVRIWWPGLTPTSTPQHHPLYVGDRIQDDPLRVLNFVTSKVWAAAVDGIAPPTLEATLFRERARAATEERLNRVRQEAAADGGPEVDGDFLAEFELQLQANDELQDLIDELQTVVEEQQHSLRQLEEGDRSDRDDEPPEVDSVLEAVELAASEASNVVYLHGAFDSAKESEFQNPQVVLDLLRIVHSVADRWAKGDLAGGFKAAFEVEPVVFKPGIGQVARTKYRTDYEIDYAGSRVLMGPHLRQGTGAVTRILRIYWYEDDTSKQLVIGHVGCKLRDASNP